MVENTTQPGFARTEVGNAIFDLPAKYEPLQMVGAGTYGQVISANNKETGAKVAIKKLSHIEDVVSEDQWSNISSLQIDAKRVLREIIIMKNLVHENILGLQDVVYVPRDG